MKKYIITIFSIAVLIFLFVYFGTQNEKKLVEKPYVQPYYIALGDSMAAGMGVPPNMGYTDNYFNNLAKKDPKTKYLNLGKGGDATDNLLNVINSNLPEISKATVITVHIGVNDLFQRLRMFEAQVAPNEITDTYDSIANNYDEIIRLLTNTAPEAKIIFLSYFNPFIEDIWFDAHVIRLNNIIKDKTQNNKLIYIDIYPEFKKTGLEYLMKNNYEEDPIHPNIEGYKAIAEQLTQLNL